MSLFLYRYLLSGGNSQSQPTASVPMTRQTQERKRLQKSPRGKKFRKDLYSCKGAPDGIQAQSWTCVAISDCYENHHGLTAIDDPAEKSNERKPHVEFLLEDHHSDDSSDDEILSMYSAMETQDQVDQPRRRMRSKTPVFAIGQLERNSLIRQSDRALDLAEEYQSQLPPRAYTPFCEEEIPRHRPHKLRKIKCQVSLRDLVREDQVKSARPRTSTLYSDADTLVGSESPSSLPSPTEEKGEKLLPPTPSLQRSRAPHPYQQVVAELDHNIGLKICADLLTNELASALYRHHPAELDERASGLQILLMIEAYEAVQQHVREMLYDAHATGGDDKHARMVDEILEHWLHVLYSVYDRAQEKNDFTKEYVDGEPAALRLVNLTVHEIG